MLKGLEITEIKLSEVKKVSGDLRIEAEHFQTKYFDLKKKLSRHNCVRLAELVSKPIQTGHTPSMKNERFYGGNIKFIKTDNLRDNDIKFPFSHYLSELGNSEIRRTELQENDIITTIIGATYDVIARSCIIHKEILPANINQNIAHIRPNTKKIIPEYLNMYLNSKYGKMYLEYLSRQMEQVNLNCEEVGNVLVPLFSTDFQKKIESLVKSAHTKLSESKSLYAEAEDILLSELGLKDWQPKNEAVSIKPFSDFASSGRLDAEFYQSKYDEIEAKIKAVPFKTIAELQVFNARGVQPDYISNGTVPVVNSKHILENGLDYDNFEKTTTVFLKQNGRATIKENDILIYTTGANIGRAQPYLISDLAVASNHVNILRLKEVNPIYAALVLNSKIGRLQTEKLCTGSAQAELYPSDIEKFLIPILPQEIQKQIAELIQTSFALRQESKQLLESAKLAVEAEIER